MQTVGSQTVGVIVPMYNGAATIEETLASVCNQTHRDLDIVVVNDGSTDQSPNIVQNWPDSRVRLLSQDNAGLSATRNRGAAATDAPYLAFLDADDIWLPRKIEAQLEAISRRPDALIWCWYDEIDEYGKFRRAPDMNPEATLQNLCRWNIVGNGSSMLVSRRAFDASGGFDTSLTAAEDYAFALEVADMFLLEVVPERLMSYRVSSSSMSSDTRKVYDNLNVVLDQFAKKHPEHRADLNIHREVAVLGLYYRSLQVRDFSAARFFYKKLKKHGPLPTGVKRNFVRSWLKFRLSGN